MKKNLQHIDEIRFLIIHLILVNHCMLSYALIRNQVNETLIVFWFEFTSPILALMSGYLFFNGASRHFNFKDKLRHRLSSLVVPYVVWSLGFFVIYFLVKELVSHLFHLSFWYQEVKPLTWKNAWMSLVNPPLVNFWYLQNLILIIPFNILFYFILKNKYLFILFFLVILYVFAYDLVPLYFSARFLPFYLMGCYFGYHEMVLPKFHSLFRMPKIQSSVLLSTIWIPFVLYVSVETGFIEYKGVFYIVLKMLIAIFLLICIYNLLDASPESWLFRYLKKYKPYSFFLFAIHTFIFTIVQRPLIQLFKNEFINKYFTLGFSILTLLPVLFISLYMGILIRNKWPRFFSIITGR